MGYSVMIRPVPLVPAPTLVETFIEEHPAVYDRQYEYALPTRLVIGTAPSPVAVAERTWSGMKALYR